MLRIAFGNAALLIVAGLAILFGSRSDRAVAVTLLAGVAATFALHPVVGHTYRSVQWPVMAVDVAVLAALAWIARKYGASSAAWIAAMQLIVVIDHPVRAVSPATTNWIYYGLTALWIYPQMAVLAWSTARHARGRGRGGS